jgi:broad specificity phosphatase PhoE
VAPEGVRVYEDPRLREVERGYVDSRSQEARRETHGWFYYRFEGGESPADCYDRTSAFLESLMRQAARKQAERAIVVTHGLTIRCFVMRFMHLKVEEFDRLDSIENCGIITIGPRDELDSPVFTSGRWGVVGLPLRPESESDRPPQEPG